MTRLPLEIENKILAYIDPDPVVYTRLATVSRYYYSLFTSDKLWRLLDVDNQKTNLFAYYISSKDPEMLVWALKNVWTGRNLRDASYDPDVYYRARINKDLGASDDEDYLHNEFYYSPQFAPYFNALEYLGHVRSLGYANGLAPNPEYKRLFAASSLESLKALDRRISYLTITGRTSNIPFMSIAISLNPTALLLVPEDSAHLPALVKRTARDYPPVLNFLLGQVLAANKHLLMEFISLGEHDFTPAIYHLVDFDFDDQFLWEAAEYMGGLSKLLTRVLPPHLYEQKSALLLRCGFFRPLLEHYSREEVEKVFRRPVESLQSDIDLFRLGIAAASELLRLGSSSVRDDKTTVLDAVRSNGSELANASDRLRADPQVCLAAIYQCPEAFDYVDPDLIQSAEFKALIDFEALDYGFVHKIPGQYWYDDQVLSVLVRKGSGSYFASQSMGCTPQNPKAIALSAIRSFPINYSYCSKELRADQDIALAAIQGSPVDFPKVPRATVNKEIALAAVRLTDNYACLPGHLQEDKDVVLEMLKHAEPGRLPEISPTVLSDPDIALVVRGKER